MGGLSRVGFSPTSRVAIMRAANVEKMAATRKVAGHADCQPASMLAISIAGGFQTENLGIERLITNVLANPFIRFVVVCGDDRRKMIPGQSLVALARDKHNFLIFW
jgi:tetrahydromethanopterin S-methyltransferase subunit A